MNLNRFPGSFRASAAFIIGLHASWFLACDGKAATFTFDRHSGVDSNWSTGTNWVGNVAPVSGSSNLEVLINSVGNSNNSAQDLGAPFELQTLRVAANNNHSVSGSPLKFSNLGAAPSILLTDPYPFNYSTTLSNDIELSNDLTINNPKGSVNFGNNVISGSGGITQLAGGQQIQFYGSSSNTYTGLTKLQSGNYVYLSKSGGTSIPGDLVIDGSTVYTQGSANQIATTSNVTINSGGLYLNGADQTLPGLTISNGYLQVDTFRTLTLTGNVFKTGTGSPSIGGQGQVDLGGGVRTFDVASQTMYVYSKIINGGINKAGAGTLYLSPNAPNTYAGGTTIAAGTLVGSVDALPSPTIANSGIVEFNQGSNATYNGVVSGTGGFTKSNSATLTLANAQGYTGLTRITGGTLATSVSEQLADVSDIEITQGALALGGATETVDTVTIADDNYYYSPGANITGSGTLTGSAYIVTSYSHQSATGSTIDAVLAGAAQLTKNGYGDLKLTAANTYTGGTVINDGSVTLPTSERLADAGSVQIGTASTYGTLKVTATETVGAITIVSGAINGGGTVIGSSYNVQSGSADANLSGAAALTKTSANTFQLNAISSYTGGTYVNGGTLSLTINERLNDAAPVEINGGALQLSYGGSNKESISSLKLIDGQVTGYGGALEAGAYDLRKGSISVPLVGSGSLTKTTGDTVSLYAINTYTGGATVSGGVLEANGQSLPGATVNNAVVRLYGGPYAGGMSGSGAVEITGSVTYTGASTYGGGTTITAGASLNGSTATLNGAIANQGVLYFNQATSGTFAGNLSGNGAIQKFDAGELELSGANSQSGSIDVVQGALAVGSATALGTSSLAMNSGTAIRASGAARTISNAYQLNGNITFGGSQNLTLSNSTPLPIPAGQTLTSTNSATTTISAPVSAAVGSTIHAAGGNFVLGSPTSFLGFQSQGSLAINAGATLTLRSAGFVDLSPLTALAGGTLAAPNGVSLGPSENVIGNGALTGKIAAQLGSVIAATTGNFTLGSVSSVSGFYSDGELRTGTNTVTINDANEVVLGSETTLGDGVNTGSLVAGTASPGDTDLHFLISEGKNLVGRGNVTGNVKNNGHVIGDGVLLAERLQFDFGYTVSGIGSFDNVLFNGTFAPGLSPGVVSGADMAVGGELKIEIGGLTPGNGPGHHDQVNDAGTFGVGETAKLEIASYGGFLPSAGQEFSILTSAGAIDGQFDQLTVDPWFIAHGVSFDLEADQHQLVATAIAVSGDFTHDGAIDGADFLAWQSTAGAQGATLAADADKNGCIDAADLNILKIQHAAAHGAVFASTAAVPEPGALALGVLAMLAAFGQPKDDSSFIRTLEKAP